MILFWKLIKKSSASFLEERKYRIKKTQMSKLISTELKSDSDSDSDSDLDSEKIGAKVDNKLMAKLEKFWLRHFADFGLKNSQRYYLLGRTSRRFLWCSLSFHFWSSFNSWSSFRFQATLSCHRHSTLASQACEGLHQLWALPRLLLIAFSFSSTTNATLLSGHFLPTGVFYRMLLPDIFGTTCQNQPIKASLGAGSSSLKFAGLHTDSRNTDPTHLFVWFTVIYNPLYILNLYLYMSILQKVLLVVKTLIKNFFWFSS